MIDIPSSTTTLMVRNIPTRFSSITLLETLKDYGFEGLFDFFYLPMDFKTEKNCGYCFINFLIHETCKEFANIFQGIQLKASTSHKCIDIVVSKRQGLYDNIAVFADSDMLTCKFRRDDFKPMIMRNGEMVPLNESIFNKLFHFHKEITALQRITV